MFVCAINRTGRYNTYSRKNVHNEGKIARREYIKWKCYVLYFVEPNTSHSQAKTRNTHISNIYISFEYERTNWPNLHLGRHLTLCARLRLRVRVCVTRDCIHYFDITHSQSTWHACANHELMPSTHTHFQFYTRVPTSCNHYVGISIIIFTWSTEPGDTTRPNDILDVLPVNNLNNSMY